MCQCRPAVAPEATGEREEEWKSEAREESESPTWRRRLAERGERGERGAGETALRGRAESEARETESETESK